MEVVRDHTPLEVVSNQTPLEVADNQTLYYGYQYDGAKSFLDHQNYHGSADSATAFDRPSPAPRGRWWWLIPALLGALVAGVIVGGAVGGSLGAALAKCGESTSELQEERLASSSNETSTTTTTVTVTVTEFGTSSSMPTTTGGLLIDYDVEAPSSIYNVTLDCDELAKTTQRSGRFDSYSVFCRVDLLTGLRVDSDGNEFIMSDMVGLRAYRFQDCIDACSSTNALVDMKTTGKGCKSVTFFNYLADSYENCWLKNGSVSAAQGRPSEDYVISAVLLD
ncbi:hypothetical protein HJFPF1_08316 [Paramyrothecium foliicola]|nr:hypothetical protein HJFPF1_08316 [Paramyrothecium foliicola]